MILIAAGGGPDVIGWIEAGLLILVLIVVGLHHVTHLAYELLHWPKWLVRHFDERKAHEARQILSQVGVDSYLTGNIRVAQTEAIIAKVANIPNPRDRCIAMLGAFTREGVFNVGEGYAAPFRYYTDIMSASVNNKVAEECANILLSHLRDTLRDTRLEFTRVIGLKGGSPTIACCFGARSRLPTALFRGKDHPKYNRTANDIETLFDGEVISGESVLIVDDSTTGGRMVVECIEALRTAECRVAACLVLFEPIGKDARKRLADKSVDLLSIVQMDEPTVEAILRAGRAAAPT